jgi:hypothetical protein
VRQVPAGVFRGTAAALRPLHPRLAALLEFGAAVGVTDAVAPTYGTRDLATYFAERMAAPAGAVAAGRAEPTTAH